MQSVQHIARICQRTQILCRSLPSSSLSCFTVHHRLFSNATAEPLPPPQAEGEPRQYTSKIQQIVEEISQLTLVEVADLNELLKKTLNIQDTPMMAMGAMPMSAAPNDVEEEAEPVQVKTSFSVKLLKFDESKKVPLIKEMKALVEGMNLVQAKKFVESAPAIVKADLGKAEAEKMKEALEKAGALVEIE